jgi:type I restriction-modification system DNA methylase subunit
MVCIRFPTRGYYFGVDKDPTCAKMAALNMLWRNVDSHIVWGNSLSLKAHGRWMELANPSLVPPLPSLRHWQKVTHQFSGLR